MSLKLDISDVLRRLANVEADRIGRIWQGVDQQVDLYQQIMSTHLTESYQRLLRAPNDLAIQATTQLAGDLKALVEENSQSLSLLGKQTARLAAQYSELTRRTAADLAAIQLVWESLLPLNFLNQLCEAVKARPVEIDAFSEAGWPLAPSMPPELVARVVSLHLSGKKRYVSQVLLGHYRRKKWAALIEMAEAWKENSLISPRLHIISEALDAHTQRKYALTYPALAPQIEGILSDYAKKNQKNVKYGKIRDVYTLALGDGRQHEFAGWAIRQVLLSIFHNSFYAYTSFSDELDKKAYARTPTRHTVLHGLAIHYNRPSESLRVFLFIDAVSILDCNAG